jgi:hypothetical protein
MNAGMSALGRALSTAALRNHVMCPVRTGPSRFHGHSIARHWGLP